MSIDYFQKLKALKPKELLIFFIVVGFIYISKEFAIPFVKKRFEKVTEKNNDKVIIPLIHEFGGIYARTSEFQDANHWKLDFFSDYSLEEERAGVPSSGYKVTRMVKKRDILDKQTELFTFICIDNGNSSLQVTRIVTEEPISVNSYKDFCVITERDSTKKVNMMLIFDCDKVPKELQFVAKNNNQNEVVFLFKREEVTMGVYRWNGKKIK
ncbi:hypothetical protein [Carnobacterium maltaromaticum]|uniref:hypothetical protein n=1 Tax=Carnobacterium maltaromaticum TaxID=2751 RepID=UPI0012F726AA|nr:hypothetical protein [Carnobacterium maltaromaticum]